jgi:hypothetical protein
MITGVVALSEASNLCLCVTALLPQHRGLSRFLYTAFPTIPMKGLFIARTLRATVYRAPGALLKWYWKSQWPNSN